MARRKKPGPKPGVVQADKGTLDGTPLLLRWPAELRERAERRAALAGLGLSELVRQAIEALLETE